MIGRQHTPHATQHTAEAGSGSGPFCCLAGPRSHTRLGVRRRGSHDHGGDIWGNDG